MGETPIGNSPLVITPDHSKDLTMSQLPQSPRPNIDKHTESIGGLDQFPPHVPVSNRVIRNLTDHERQAKTNSMI